MKKEEKKAAKAKTVKTVKPAKTARPVEAVETAGDAKVSGDQPCLKALRDRISALEEGMLASLEAQRDVLVALKELEEEFSRIQGASTRQAPREKDPGCKEEANAKADKLAKDIFEASVYAIPGDGSISYRLNGGTMEFRIRLEQKEDDGMVVRNASFGIPVGPLSEMVEEFDYCMGKVSESFKEETEGTGLPGLPPFLSLMEDML